MFRPLPVLLLSLLVVASASAQHTYDSLGGYGNVLYPGTGHAPNAPFLSNVAQSHGGGSRNGGRQRVGGGAIVPFPLYYGNYFGNYYDPNSAPPPQQDQGNQVPSVVINQTFIPDRPNPMVQDYGGGQPSGMTLYQGPPGPYQQQDAGPGPAPTRQRMMNGSDEPTLYLIAFRDHSIVQALGYWMEGGTLHYVSVEHTLNQASIDLIDKSLSQRLNDERGVEFKLPAAAR
jgi:hypothetical protein